MDREKIKAQAKKIMDEFLVALDKVKDTDVSVGISRDENVRVPVKAVKDEEFRKRMLVNAPKKDSDYIIAEKKSW